MNRRDTLIALSALSSLGLARAEPAARAPRYGVLSAIGRELGIITYLTSTDSRVKPNDRRTVTLDEDLFDLEALRMIQTGVQKSTPDAGKVMLYVNHDAELARHPETLFDHEQLVLPDALLQPMVADGVERLLLLTRHRRTADLQAHHASVGAGMLEGLGYYVDYSKRMRRNDTGEVGRGYIAPYVYLRLTLVDLPRRAVLREQMVDISTTLSAARSKADNADPWATLTSQQKVDHLVRMMDHQLAETLPQLLAAG